MYIVCICQKHKSILKFPILVQLSMFLYMNFFFFFLLPEASYYSQYIYLFAQLTSFQTFRPSLLPSLTFSYLSHPWSSSPPVYSAMCISNCSPVSCFPGHQQAYCVPQLHAVFWFSLSSPPQCQVPCVLFYMGKRRGRKTAHEFLTAFLSTDECYTKDSLYFTLHILRLPTEKGKQEGKNITVCFQGNIFLMAVPTPWARD